MKSGPAGEPRGEERDPKRAASAEPGEVSQAGVRGLAAHLVAYDVLEAALRAGQPDEAWVAVRAELEVLDRRSLLNVAMVLAVESTVILTPRTGRPAFQERLQRRHLDAMVADR